jgi:hypothetical protein
MTDETGPSSRQAFLWDLLPENDAPSNDGVVAPIWGSPTWIESISDDQLDAALASEESIHQQNRETASALEAKASRLLTPLIALLAGTVALSAFTLKVGLQADWPVAIAAWSSFSLAACSTGWLFTAIVRALDADTRMGIYGNPGTEKLIQDKREFLEQISLAAAVASWTANQKATRIIHARAAASRAVLALALALLCSAGTMALSPGSTDSQLEKQPSPSTPSPSPSASSSSGSHSTEESPSPGSRSNSAPSSPPASISAGPKGPPTSNPQ